MTVRVIDSFVGGPLLTLQILWLARGHLGTLHLSSKVASKLCPSVQIWLVYTC